MEQVGHRLRFLREKAHLTQAKIAELLGTRQPAINRYEHGQAAAPFSILRGYTHVTDKMQQEAAEKMGNFMEMTF